MIHQGLSHQEAEAILRQLAGPTSAEQPEIRALSNALTDAQKRAVSHVASRRTHPEALHRTWSETTFRTLIDTAPDALVICDFAGTILLLNAKAESLFGYNRQELLGVGIELLIPDLLERGLPPDHSSPRPSSLETLGRRKDDRSFPLEISLSPLEGEQGLLISSTIRDISDRKRLEARYRNLVEGIPAVTFMAALDEGNNELYVSPQIEQLLGFSQKEWLSDPVLWYTRLHPEDRERWHIEFAETLATAAPFRSVYRFRARDDRVVWVQGEAKVVRDNAGRPLFLQGIAFDITDRKVAEEALKKAHDELDQQVQKRTAELAGANQQLQGALTEKESLLKEIHHRVKNNLQIISSLLNLQAKTVTDPSTLQAIRESQNRVRSMALIHEKLYQSHDLSRIAFRQYIRELVAHLVRSYGSAASDVRIDVDIDDVALTIDTAIPTGLIITELVSNCLKHAFPDKRRGEIIILLRTNDQGIYCLEVRDNGVGLPPSLDPLHTQSLGMQLVQTLTSQLRGILQIRNEAGASFTLQFRELPPR